MNRDTKRSLNSISKDEYFDEVIKKLVTGESMTQKEEEFALSCSIIFIRYFEKDPTKKSFLEFSYYIILKYSIMNNKYDPLFDFAVNFGFYPVADEILRLGLIKEEINNIMYKSRIADFSFGDYIETFEQQSIRNRILNSSFQEVSFIAPTSFGKSSIIIEHIKREEISEEKICIIVPTKSLLMQTYNLIKESSLNRRVIIHDDMYENEDIFIAIFTQERALRMIEKYGIAFDVLFIDEAHNLLKFDDRSVLLSRAIRKAKNINNDLRVVYLTPLINDSDSLKISNNQEISQFKIDYNIKEPEIFELRLDGSLYIYNRFLNRFYLIQKTFKPFEYINNQAGVKNFLYLRSPKKIEFFSKTFSEKLPSLADASLINVAQVLEKYVHEDYYQTELVRKGLVYLHGKIPELIKEFLEYKFKRLDSLKYVVANSVILEGMNLPIDSLFVLNVHSLYQKELTNLIGRVNRLNNIFGVENKLRMLLPRVHFVNTEDFNRKGSKMENKIMLLRSSEITDIVKNPVLEHFDEKKLSPTQLERANIVTENEEIIFDDNRFSTNIVYRYMIREGINDFYEDPEFVSHILESRFKIDKVASHSLFELIHVVFLEGVDQLVDLELKRLQNKEARNYYTKYIENIRKLNIRGAVGYILKDFKWKINNDNPYLYFGESYGEIAYPSPRYQKNGKPVYVNLSTKTEIELVNLAVVKLELENKFVKFKLNKLITMLYDFHVISEDDYNMYIFGTTDENYVKLVRHGLSIRLTKFLVDNNQIDNIWFDENNNLRKNNHFDIFLDTLDEFQRYEVERNF